MAASGAAALDRNDYGHLAANQIGRQRRQSVVLTRRGAVFDRHALARDVAHFIEALPAGRELPIIGVNSEPKNIGERDILIICSIAHLFGWYGWVDYRLPVNMPDAPIVPVRVKFCEPPVPCQRFG